MSHRPRTRFKVLLILSDVPTGIILVDNAPISTLRLENV